MATVFQDVEIGVKARIFRLNENGGINSRKLEIVEVIDDSGSEETLKSAVEEIVDQDILPSFYCRQQPAQLSRTYLLKIICLFRMGIY